METLTKTIKVVDDWTEQFEIRDAFLEQAGAMLEGLMAAIELVYGPDDYADLIATQESARY